MHQAQFCELILAVSGEIFLSLMLYTKLELYNKTLIYWSLEKKQLIFFPGISVSLDYVSINVDKLEKKEIWM